MAKRKAAPKESQGQSETPAAAPEDSVYIGKSIKPEFIYLRLANRHGLITGATGTGKTVTLQGLAEGFSAHGVPVFCADVKGDLSGIAMKGEPKAWIEARAKEIGFTPEFQAYPVIFWDLFGKQGHPIRATHEQATRRRYLEVHHWPPSAPPFAPASSRWSVANDASAEQVFA